MLSYLPDIGFRHKDNFRTIVVKHAKLNDEYTHIYDEINKNINK